MTGFGQPDTGIPLPSERRASKYPKDTEAVERASTMIAAGSTARAAILEAIDKVYPIKERSADFDLESVHRRIFNKVTDKYNQNKRGPFKNSRS